jgi:hypothetical protein
MYGDVSLSLPSSFRGPIAIRTGDNRIVFSPAFAERVVRKVENGIMATRAQKLMTTYWITFTDHGKYTYTGTRINLGGEGKVPTMGLNVWKSFCSGVERRLNGPITRLTSSHDDGLSICPSCRYIY